MILRRGQTLLQRRIAFLSDNELFFTDQPMEHLVLMGATIIKLLKSYWQSLTAPIPKHLFLYRATA